jgi:hypothetical protein
MPTDEYGQERFDRFFPRIAIVLQRIGSIVATRNIERCGTNV